MHIVKTDRKKWKLLTFFFGNDFICHLGAFQLRSRNQTNWPFSNGLVKKSKDFRVPKI